MTEYLKCDDCNQWIKKEEADYYKMKMGATYHVCGQCSALRRTKKYGNV